MDVNKQTDDNRSDIAISQDLQVIIALQIESRDNSNTAKNLISSVTVKKWLPRCLQETGVVRRGY